MGNEDLIPWEPQYPYKPVNKRKRKYMEYRVMGHSKLDSLELAGVSERTYFHWKQHDKDFAYWCSLGLEKLRVEKRDDLIGVQFIKISQLVMEKDLETVKDLLGIPTEHLSAEQSRMLARLRQIYSNPSNLKMIQEFVEGRSNTENSLFKVLEVMAEKKQIKAVEGEFREIGEASDEVPHLPPTNAPVEEG